MKLRTGILAIATLVVLGGGIIYGLQRGDIKALHASFGGEALSLIVADTDTLRSRGLSGYAALEPNEGMLFVFFEDGYHQFWMKDMKFPIDIIWLDAEYRIIDAKKGVSPDSYPTVFTPQALSRYVLEVPAGFFENHSLKTGNILEIIK